MYDCTVANILCTLFIYIAILQYILAHSLYTTTSQLSHLFVYTTDTIQAYLYYHADDTKNFLI